MAGRVFSVPAGISLVDALAAGLIAQYGGPPETLASVLVLVPTRRAVRSLREAFLRQSGGKALILPAIRPLGDVDEDDLALASFAEAEAVADLPPAIPPLRRRLLLARRIHAAGSRLGPVSDEQAAQLADALAAFLDEVATNEADLDGLRDLVEDTELAQHWETTLAFLNAAIADWPQTLERLGYLDPAERRRRLFDRLTQHWSEHPPAHPVIAAGSTGTIPATARLLATVAGLPQGAVVLPGLDHDMDAGAWEAIEPSHPQFALKALLERLETKRDGVAPWPLPNDADLPETSPARRRLLSDALLPAAQTANWPAMAAPDEDATAGLEIATCANPRVEAEIAAMRMREELASPGRTVALVTRDRDLARRVASELRRWDIAVDDSAGTPLLLTRGGTFLRLIAAAAADRLAPVPLLALLKHPLTRLGEEDGHTRQLVRRLELAILRGPRPAPGLDGLEKALAEARLASPALHGLLRGLRAALGPLLGHFESQQVPLDHLVRAHVQAALALAEGPEGEDGGALFWSGDDGEALNTFLADLAECADAYGFVVPRAWPALFDTLAGSQVVRPRFGLHPRAFVWGPLEARMQHADCVILGGLVEGNWPPEPPADPWMSRPMRRRFGLSSPEQRIGQAAHDFVQAASAPSAVLLHAERAEGAPCVPARWIVRLEAFLAAKGADTAPYRATGRRQMYRALLDRPGNVEPAAEPRPCPPLAARPRALSVTEIGTWLADPYAIYARRVLDLEPLDEIDEDASASVRGTFVHKALEAFVKEYPEDLPDDAYDKLIAIGHEAMEGPLDRPAVRALWWRRFERIAAWFIGVERERRQGLTYVHAERRGRLSFEQEGLGTFTLIAKADRLEIDDNGAVHVIDYKTGTVPSDKAVASGSAPQLPLEAAMVREGAFPEVAAAPIAEIAHWKLSGGQPAGLCRNAKARDMTAEDIADAALAGLKRLVAAFAEPAQPYLDHPGGAPIGRYDAYSDVARTREWRLGPDIMMPDLPPPPDGPRPHQARRGYNRQQRMSDPERTVWVAASAGTGKTKVLTDRVLRLLLCGTPPERILCLTFTKAAAAEMAIRVRQELAVWLALDDDALEADLAALMGRPATAEEHASARHLFALVLDAPGGLKIATIHSFCQSLLGRFPLEAGVAPHFALIEDRGRDELLHSARERVLSHIVESGDEVLAADLDTLAVLAGESRLADLVGEICSAGRRLRRAVARHGSLPGLLRATGRALGLEPEETGESIAAAACQPGEAIEVSLRHAAEVLLTGSKTDAERGAGIAAWLAADAAMREAGFEDYAGCFLTAKREPQKNLATKAIREGHPDVQAALEAEQARIVALDARLRAAATLARTGALLRLGGAVLEEFRRLKEDRAVLDYDDLIERAQALLTTSGMAAWVLFKLDGGIDHVLVDEAQDTNPDQWDVVKALTEEFFAGEGASEVLRTLFVVGDETQSIFSFQGADLDALRVVHDELRERVEAAACFWHEEPLDTSWRSVPAVLDTVDAVFADAAAADGVAFGGVHIRHDTVRTDDGGLVELWPPVEDEALEPRDVWLAPIETEQPRNRHARLAAAIANRIAELAGDDGAILPSRGTPIRAGDIMILVRKRSEVVGALVRELRRVNIPVAGVDRMDLTGQVVVRDLMALIGFCLMPEDDVALAAVLKGPFVDFDEATLFALAFDRPRHDAGGREKPESLWATLRRREWENDAFARARAWLGTLLGLADQMAPVEFLSHVLTHPAATQDGFGGRKALVRRLGLEALDPLDELVNLAFVFEREHPPSLQSFLWWLGSGSAEVKREPEGAGDVVRIMTVHGAKGLQAPIVFLIDDIGAQPGRHESLLWDDGRQIALWPGAAGERDTLSGSLLEARKQREAEEERRLLYVAMTRARDRLYIATSKTGEDREGLGWSSLIRRGMESMDGVERFAFTAPGETWAGEGLRLERRQTRAVDVAAAPVRETGEQEALPELYRLAMAAERPADRPLSPSRLGGAEPAPPSPLTGDDGAGLRRGRVVHRLLELLPVVAAANRRDAALRLIARHAPDWDAEAAGALADTLLALLDDPAHAALFARGSAAEVSIVGQLGEAVIAGQVDRLVVTPDAVLIVDYKTGTMPRSGIEGTPEAYLRQLAAYRAVLAKVYPGRAVQCALLWVDYPEFLPIPDSLLDRYEPRAVPPTPG